MYEDWIGSLDENSAAPGTKQVLQAYFNESIPASDAATSLLDSLECSVERLAFLLIKASQEIPDSQPMLVELVQALRQLEGIDLKEFGWTMRDRWNFFDLPASDPSYRKNRADWLFINAFAARLTATSSLANSETSFSKFGLWTIRSALEDENELDANISAAVQWVKYAGTKLYDLDEEYKPQKGGGDPGRGGALWKGKRGFSRERWDFWQGRFQKIAEGNGDSETKNWALMASERMLEMQVKSRE